MSDWDAQISSAEEIAIARRRVNTRLGFWLAAALDDPEVCEDMKAAIRAWFAFHPGAA